MRRSAAVLSRPRMFEHRQRPGVQSPLNLLSYKYLIWTAAFSGLRVGRSAAVNGWGSTHFAYMNLRLFQQFIQAAVMKYRIILGLALAATVSGCVKPPATAEGFRQLANSGSRWVEVEKFVVNRPYHAVARTFQSRSDSCLRVQVTSTTSGGYRSHGTTFKRDYRPTVKVGKRRTEFYVQIHIEGTNLVRVYDEAKGGDYVMIADAYPAGRNKTRIELHRASIGHDVLSKAVRNWATGRNLGCPDLTK